MAPKEIRIPAVKTLYEMLPKGAEGGKEFARLMDLLLFHEGRRTGKKMRLFSDVAGDYRRSCRRGIRVRKGELQLRKSSLGITTRQDGCR